MIMTFDASVMIYFLTQVFQTPFIWVAAFIGALSITLTIIFSLVYIVAQID